MPSKTRAERLAQLAVRMTVMFAAVCAPIPARSQGLGSDFDAKVVETMRTWGAPGMVVVVVRAGHTIHLKGYGTRVLGEILPIDSLTRVQIASHSKAVTATALAMLVDAGKLAWDDPVVKHIPEFVLPDSVTSPRVTVRDLALHRSGLPLAALGGFDNPAYSIHELLAALRTRTAPTPFRERQVYSNVGYALAGEVVARASGMPWEQFVRERIFTPLGMTSSYTSNPDLMERFGTPSPDKNVLLSATRAGGVVARADWKGVGTGRLYAPAGGITTTATDLARWMTFLLQNGEHSGTRLLSIEALNETRTPAILLDRLLTGITAPIAALAAGSPGWMVVPYAGRRILEAPGGWMSSMVALIPEEQLGIAVATNAYFSERALFESVHLVGAVVMHAIDAALGLPKRDWSTAFEATLTSR